MLRPIPRPQDKIRFDRVSPSRLLRAKVLGMPDLGKLLVVMGGAIVLIGALLWSGWGGWLGRMPGDIRIERGHSGFYFPIATCIIISILLSVIVSFFRR